MALGIATKKIPFPIFFKRKPVKLVLLIDKPPNTENVITVQSAV
jgi:hypothetical protein